MKIKNPKEIPQKLAKDKNQYLRIKGIKFKKMVILEKLKSRLACIDKKPIKIAKNSSNLPWD